MAHSPLDDPIKTMALAAWVVWLVSKMRRVFKLWNEHPQAGLTVKNGEYAALVQALGQIVQATQQLVRGQTLIVERVDGLTRRMDAVEGRLP